MRDNKIDKLFKEKTTQGSFTYKDSYWKGAEKLIVANQVAANGRFWSAGKAISIISFITMMSFGSTVWFDQPKENTISNTIEETPLFKTPADDFSQTDAELNNTTSNSSSLDGKNDKIKDTNEMATQEAFVDDASNESERSEKLTPTASVEQGELSEENKNVLKSEVGELETTEATAIGTQEEPKIEQFEISQPELAPIKTTDPLASNSVSEAFAPSTQQTEESSKKSTDEIEGNHSDESGVIASSNKPSSEKLEEGEMNPPIKAESQLSRSGSEPNIASSKTKEEDIILPHQAGKNWLFSIGADYSYLFTSRVLTGQPADYVGFRNTYESNSHSTSMGLQVIAERGHWIFNSGIYQTSFIDNIAYPQILDVLIGVDNGQWNVQENWSYAIDSSWQITGIYQGGWNYDTLWSVTYDSNYVAQWDSVITQKEDPTIAANNGKSTFSYIEVPLWFGRTFGEGRWQFFVQGGASIGILSGTKGSIYINRNVDGLLKPEYQIEQFNQFTYQAMLRAGVRFDVSPQIQATLAPMMRYTLNSVLQGEALNQRYLGYGLNVGLSYRF